MKRALILLLVGLSLSVASCASDVEDPLPPAPVPEEQRLPPDQPLSTELRDPEAILRHAAEIDRGIDDVPPILVLPPPTPWPEAR